MYENCGVTSIDVKEDDFGTKRVHTIHTDKGSIRTDKVVNCAGGWQWRALPLYIDRHC